MTGYVVFIGTCTLWCVTWVDMMNLIGYVTYVHAILWMTLSMLNWSFYENSMQVWYTIWIASRIHDMNRKYDIWYGLQVWHDDYDKYVMIHEHVMIMHDALDLKGAANWLF